MNGNLETNRQVVGNAGLFYACYELSKRGWNVLPTSRNARGVDIVIYDKEARNLRTVQVKALAKRNPVPLGNTKDSLIADYLVICRGVLNPSPEVFIATMNEVKERIHEVGKDDEKSYWLEIREYEMFKRQWDTIGS